MLGTLPGVEVSGSDLSAASARIEFSATGIAVEALQRLALGANVCLEPWPSASASGSVKHTLVAGTAANDTIEFGELQLLGIHLAWHLHRLGLLATPRANLLLRNWHAALVGA